jgi:glycosyltransferase involved in cell wall biosynthesis
VFHGWPLGSLESLRVASQFGICTFLERPNAHTAHAYEVSRRESEKLKIRLPRGHDHEFNWAHLEREEMEYRATNHLLCPSEFVSRTFSMRDFSENQLVRHHYGFDDRRFFPENRMIQPEHSATSGIVALFAGSGEPRKGLHFALQAWQRAGVGHAGRFLICGHLIPAYREALSPWLNQPGVKLLGPTDSLEQVMRQADVLIAPSLEEGSALVTYEAIGSGCVPLVSDCTGAMCSHEVDALIHPAGDVETLAGHIAMVDSDRAMLSRLRASGLQRREQLTWKAAGRRLLQVYTEACNAAA